MDLQETLMQCFVCWRPQPPSVEARSRRDVTLAYSAGPFSFLQDQLLYKVQKKEKIPPWITVYSGGKTRKTIENLAPGHPHKFRVQVIIRASAVGRLAELATAHHGDEETVREQIEEMKRGIERSATEDGNDKTTEGNPLPLDDNDKTTEGDPLRLDDNDKTTDGDPLRLDVNHKCYTKTDTRAQNKWLESGWSVEVWTSTDSEGTSAACFCMAVRCGYLVQVQQMLAERPELIGVINSGSGLTPLATAARKGDVHMVKFLLSAGAEVDQRSSAGQSPLQLALLAARTAVAELLLEKGADFKARDRNELRAEHCAVDSGDLDTVRFVLDRGGDVRVVDSNGWTPLFRAVSQGAALDIIRELLDRGSDVNVTDRAGLSLSAVARVSTSRLGKSRDSVLKLVDSQYQHEKAVANFTRITKKISSISTLLNLK